MLNQNRLGGFIKARPTCHGSSSYLLGPQVTAGNIGGATCLISVRRARNPAVESIDNWEGAIRLPKASLRFTCKPLKTMAEHHFTSKCASTLEGCEADCNLAPPTMGMKVHCYSPTSLRKARVSYQGIALAIP